MIHFIAHSVEFYCGEFYSYDKQQVCVVLLCDHKQFQATKFGITEETFDNVVNFGETTLCNFHCVCYADHSAVKLGGFHGQ